MRHDALHKAGLVAAPPPESAILPLVLMVLNDFDRNDIVYFYWKSSNRVYRGLTGEGDVDLLVAKQDQHRAQAILLDLGLKSFPPVAHRDHPSVLSFLGHDEPSGRIIHLHLHIRLIAGNSLLKNYHLPWEEELASRTVVHPVLPIRMLAPVDEALLLIVRACLELTRSDLVVRRNWQATTRKFALDRAELAGRLPRAALRQRAAELLSDDLADGVADALYSDLELQDQRHLRRRIREHFTPHRTYNGLEAELRILTRTAHLVAGYLNKRFLWAPRPWSRRAPGGGHVIAVIGVDGSGKSTIVATVREWLGQEMDVIPIYFGTGAGRPSLILWPLKLMVPLITPLLKTKPKGSSHGKISDRPPGRLYTTLLSIWATVAAIEKRIKLSSAHRGARRGLIVVTDRYPQNEIAGFNEGPLMPRLTGVPRWLQRFESRAYSLAQRLPPDLVIKLIVPPEVCARREPDMDQAVIMQRIAAIPRLTFSGARVVSIDAQQPLAEVIRAVRKEVWQIL
jgi:thymidylate kinase